MAKRKRKLKKEASLVIGGIVIFLIFVIVSIVIKKNLEVTMEKKISSPVITVNDNIVTLKDFSYYIITMEEKVNEMAIMYDEENPVSYWNLYMNDGNSESGYITDIARRTAIDFCVRDNIYALEAEKAGLVLTDEEMEDLRYDAEQFYVKVSVKGRENTHIDVLSIEKAMRTERLAYKYIMQLANEDEEGVLQSVVLKYDVGGLYYEALKNDYNIKIENTILNEVNFGFVSIN